MLKNRSLNFKKKSKIDLIIFLSDFTAEGCPILALNLIDELKKKKLSTLVVRFYKKNNELLDKFINRKGIDPKKLISLNIRDQKFDPKRN